MKKMTGHVSKGMLMCALICGTLASNAVPAFAGEMDNDSLSEFMLDPMIVTAQRRETKDLETPAATSVITAKEIERSGAKTAYEIIERQVGLTNNAYGPGGREFGGSCSRTVLRGLDKGTLVLVNGAPINMLNYNNTSGIPVQAIEKIEVVRGAQSALYGAEAFGGVINIITKQGGAAKTTLSYGGGNYDQKWSLSTSGENFNAYISRDYYGEEDSINRIFEKSTNKWINRDSTKTSAFVNFAPTNNLSFQYAHTQGKYYRDGWTLKNYKLTGAGKSNLYDDTRDNVSAIYNDVNNRFRTVLSYNKREVDPYTGVIKNFQMPQLQEGTSSNWKTSNLTLDIQKGWDLRNENDNLIIGMTLQKEKANDRSVERKIGKKKFYFDMSESRSNIALYTSYTHQFTPKFSTTLGLRGQHVNDPAKNQNVLLPQVQTLYKLSDSASWYTNIGKSYQMPALNQYFKPGSKDELKPQEGWTYETGIKIITPSSSWKFDVFYMDIDAKFDWILPPDGDKNNQKLVNVGKFKNTGVEAEYTANLNKNWQLRLGAMYADPKTKDKDSNEFAQSDARFQFTTGLDYQSGKFTSNLNYLYLGKREISYYDSLGNSGKGKVPKIDEHTTPHRSLLNANFIYTPDQHHSISLSLNNILDRKDVINKYENWGMPFNWMLTYKYTF